MLAMIRVIYRWDVEADARDNFIQEWRRMTEWIRSEFDGRALIAAVSGIRPGTPKIVAQ